MLIIVKLLICSLLAAISIAQSQGIWKCSPVTSKNPPPNRRDHATAYWQQNRSMILFGGQLEPGTYTSELYLFLFDTMTWVNLSGSIDNYGQYSGGTVAIGARAKTSIALNEFTRTLYVFGGYGRASEPDHYEPYRQAVRVH